MYGHSGFPTIRHIDDVLPSISGREDFAIKRGAGYTAIDYIFAAEDTFADPIRRELRGIKFGSDGKIIARPFHKFFNLGEKPETQQDVVPWADRHVVLEKLDGSMVHPALVDGNLRWMTRAGTTDIADDAAVYAIKHGLVDRCAALLQAGVTPIFEWCSPHNQIVIRYAEDRLVLTGARHTVTGEYLPHGQEWHDAVKEWGGSTRDLAAFIQHVKELQDAEGYVVRFSTGAMLKIKADDYVMKHKAKDSILLEKNVLRIVLENATDDVLPLLAEADAVRLKTYAGEVVDALVKNAAILSEIIQTSKDAGEDRKTFALTRAAPLAPIMKGPAFSVWQGGDALQSIKTAVLKYCGSQTDVDSVRGLIGGVEWRI